MSNPALWGLLAVIVYIVVVAFSFWVEGDLDDAFDVAQALIAGIVILVGAVYAAYRFQIHRELQPHLTISQDVTHRQLSNSYFHVEVTATLKNSSKVKIEIQKMLFRFQKLAPTTDADARYFRDAVFVNRKEDIPWPTCYERKRQWNENQCVVEPGESLQATAEFIVPLTVKSALLYTYVYNSKQKKGSRAVEGWPASKFHDFPHPTPDTLDCERGGDEDL